MFVVLNVGSVRRAWLINRVGVAIIPVFVGEKGPSSLAPSISLEQNHDEQSLRWSVIYQTVRGEFSNARASLQRYVTAASPQQIEQMERWITGWSLQLANQGEQSHAERTMRLLFALGDEAKAYVGLGQLYENLGYTEEAERFLKESLAVEPTAAGFMRLGELYAEEGMHLIQTDYHKAMHLLDQASKAFESAARTDNSVSVYANYRLGDIYWKLNRRQDAVVAYRQAAEDDGTGHYAFLCWYYLGHIYFAWWNGGLDYELARSYFERALATAATRREEAMSLSGIGATYAAQGRNEEAIAAYLQAIRRDPTYEHAQGALDSLDGE